MLCLPADAMIRYTPLDGSRKWSVGDAIKKTRIAFRAWDGSDGGANNVKSDMMEIKDCTKKVNNNTYEKYSCNH